MTCLLPRKLLNMENKYELRFTPAAKRFFKKVVDKKLKEKINEALTAISQNPLCGTQKKGDLQGIWGYDIYYNQTNYEIAYKIYELPDKIVIVIMAGTRENFYAELKRYIF